MNNTWYDLFHSRKFYAALIGVVLVVLHQMLPSFPLSDDELSKIIYLLIAYILGTGLSDSGVSSVTMGYGK